MLILTKEYRVRYYEVDHRARVRPVTILDYLQDAASEHTIRLGIAVADLRPRNLTWVLSRTQARFLHYPHAGDCLRVQTWPSGREGLFALRDFEVKDQEERLVALATTSWAVIDVASGRPVRLDSALPDYPLHERRALASDFKSLPQMAGFKEEMAFRVRRADLDINDHVNNTVYPAWALEAVPSDVEESCQLADLEIGYRAPVTYGDRVLSRIQDEVASPSPTFLHQLVSERDGRELTRLRSSWIPRD
ncbi:acyl-[acyl-carrier-protein] thioesterase [Trichloromonas sp.]|uniref:acyl-[acyl-carrier-protein] thioesterase n=1 Tax=Trichloromonas sp. TaxID=3069249 RepID=UPI003D8134E3